MMETAAVASVPTKTFTIGVVMATYYKERLTNLQASLHSILGQTLAPDRIVIVADGPIPEDHRHFLEEMKVGSGCALEVAYLDRNVGCYAARNVGVRRCETEYVAIMDSDDICEPDRLAKQYSAILMHRADVTGTWHTEFDDLTGKDIALKTCPTTDEGIKKSLRFRCLLPDVSVIFKRRLFLDVGGYPEIMRVATGDHLLFMRIAKRGGRFFCIDEPLIRVRVDLNQRKRRTGLSAMHDDILLRKEAYRMGYISLPEAIIYCIVFLGFRLIPAKLKPLVFHIIRRPAV